jgi:competence transcription factor ComK
MWGSHPPHQLQAKIPIPINTHKGIYFFPTHSPNHIDNHWISFQPILHITNQQTNGQAPKETMITFTNGNKLKLNISKYILENQMRRTFECIYLSERKTMHAVVDESVAAYFRNVNITSHVTWKILSTRRR